MRALLLLLVLLPLTVSAQLYNSPAFKGAAAIKVSGGGSYTAKAVSITDLLLRTPSSLTGAGSISSKKATWSFWIKTGVSCSSLIDEDGDDIDFSIAISAANATFTMSWVTTSGNVAVTLSSSATTSGTWNSNTWHHVFLSIDVGASVCQLYVDGTSITTGATFPNNLNLQWNDGQWKISAFSSFEGSLADVWICAGVQLDGATQLTLFRSGGKPVNLGSDGSTPTGSSPIIFMTGDATTFANNNGTGGGPWNVYGGSLVTDSSGP